SIADPAARVDAARRFAAMLALPGMTQHETDALLRNELRRLAERDDSALFHDDLAVPNDPVYFHELVEHAARHGLTFLAEAKLSMMGSVALAPGMRELLEHVDRLAREQYLDFARLRRFRHSLLCRDVSSTGFTIARKRLRGMWIVAATPLLRAAAEGKSFGADPAAAENEQAVVVRALLQWLAELAPRAVSIEETRAWLEQRFPPGTSVGRDLDALIVDVLFSGAADLRTRPTA